MKKRVITGLVGIFAVVLIGGGLVSLNMSKLYELNQARYFTDEICNLIDELDVTALKSIKELEQARLDKSRIQNLIDNVTKTEVLMRDLDQRVMSKSLANNSCGPCHEKPARLVGNLQEITGKMEESLSDLTMLTSILVTSDLGVGLDKLVREIGGILGGNQSNLMELRSILSPMMKHINLKVSGNIVRIKTAHNTTIIIVTCLVLMGIIIMAVAVTGPIKQLTRGTQAIVKGDYDFRIQMEGQNEAAILAQRFNYMAEVLANRENHLNQKTMELEDLNETLERKVRARTKELREKQEELNKKYSELEAVNVETRSSYLQLQSTTGELEEAQTKLQENFNILKVMNEELQRANEVKNKFLAIMSHELRTPLTVIHGYLSLVLDKDYGRPSKELRDILMVVKDQGHNQLELIEDLLDLTRIESGEFQLQRESIAIVDLISKSVENFRPKYEEKEINIAVDVDDDMPPVYWDFQKILQVLQNLLDNAVKFTPDGGEIGISAHAKSAFIELRVRDDGIGIPKDQIDHVFDRFYQVDSSSTRRFGGSGLGLSIVREIILAHNGKIFVESDEGEGTCFLMLIPVGEPDRVRQNEPAAPAAVEDRPREGPRGNGEKILVVDDDEAFLKMMKMILPREGYDVHSTPDSTRVLSIAKKQGSDLVLLDLMMPDVDGFEVCRRLRSDAILKDIPILVVSAAGGKDVARKVSEAGADGHIAKPFDQAGLLNHIDRLLKEFGKRSQGSDKEVGPDKTSG